MGPLDLIELPWAPPSAVRAAVVARGGGYSTGPFAGANMSFQVGDHNDRVAHNRRLLQEALALPAPPQFLHQVHGAEVFDAGAVPTAPPTADAAVLREPGAVAVLTADCLPVFFCDRSGQVAALAHAGWRGVLAGVLEAVVDRLAVPGDELMACLGPGIAAHHFEVGDEVREAFVAEDRRVTAHFERAGRRWLCDLYGLARLRLKRAGVHDVAGGDNCTYCDRNRYFSYRRDGHTGRFASVIALRPPTPPSL
ncbi:MAG: peptidoglycan editing factor PgeF [Pseudomonadota bacterium]|nr:peptidoglycan editing factor PgeF [Pseudomonadota bacterium]